jgi:hypothetical protein
LYPHSRLSASPCTPSLLMMIWADPASGELLCGDQKALCLAGLLPCAYPTHLDGVSRPASLVEGNRIFPPFSSLDSSLDSCHIHPPKIPWGWGTFPWHWASQGTPPSLVLGGGRCASLMPEIPPGLLFRPCSLSEPTGVLVAGLSSWTPRDDLDLSSSGPPVLAPFLSSHRLSKRTGRAFSRGSPSSLRL